MMLEGENRVSKYVNVRGQRHSRGVVADADVTFAGYKAQVWTVVLDRSLGLISLPRKGVRVVFDLRRF